MPNVSPAKWHLAHVTWFFETFILERHLPGYETFNPEFKPLFNSYYKSAGPQYFRPHRGHLSRPTVWEVYEYRAYVDRAVSELVELTGPRQLPEIGSMGSSSVSALLFTPAWRSVATRIHSPSPRCP